MNASLSRFLSAITILAVTLPTSADANAPSGRYVVTADGTVSGTVYDTKTKLTWQQAVPPMVGTVIYSWANAKTYCSGVGTTLGGTGWRVPTIKELLTIVDYSQMPGSGQALIDRNAFPGTPDSVYFWSSSLLAGSSSSAWSVRFEDGSTSTISVSAGNIYVRCVR